MMILLVLKEIFKPSYTYHNIQFTLKLEKKKLVFHVAHNQTS